MSIIFAVLQGFIGLCRGLSFTFSLQGVAWACSGLNKMLEFEVAARASLFVAFPQTLHPTPWNPMP